MTLACVKPEHGKELFTELTEKGLDGFYASSTQILQQENPHLLKYLNDFSDKLGTDLGDVALNVYKLLKLAAEKEGHALPKVSEDLVDKLITTDGNVIERGMLSLEKKDPMLARYIANSTLELALKYRQTGNLMAQESLRAKISAAIALYYMLEKASDPTTDGEQDISTV